MLLPWTGCAKKKAPAKKAATRKASAGGARVVLVRDPLSVDAKGRIQAARVAPMLAAGLKALTGDTDPRKALSRWLRPADTVGLKVNCLAGRRMSTSVPLVEAMSALLAAAGVDRQRQAVFDRSDEDLLSGGFAKRTSGAGYRVVGNDHVGYEEELEVMPSGASRCAILATRSSSLLINMPILKDHGLAGVSGALKNNFGLVHNPNKFHLNGCDPHVAEVNALPFVRQKQKLVVCDALRVQADGGPAFHPAGAVSFGGILLATDPVALDVIAWELLERLRKDKKLPTLIADKRAPVHIASAARAGLGVGNRRRIQLRTIKVGA